MLDGVTSGGVVNAYAAQSFAETILASLRELHTTITPDNLETLSTAMLEQCTRLANNPKHTNPAYDAEGGSATVAFAIVNPTPQPLAPGIVPHDPAHGRPVQVLGAAVGDAAAYVIDSQKRHALRLNTVVRRNGSARDTGGQITMGQGILGTVCTFTAAVHETGFVLLATDGLTDNVNEEDSSAIIPLIMSSPYFDSIPARPCETLSQPTPHLPSLVELAHALDGGPQPQALDTVSCATAAQRLVNYIDWITQPIQRAENQYYQAMLQEADLSQLKQTLEIQMTREALVTSMRELEAARKAGHAGKTDDCMIVVFKPLHPPL